MSFDVEGYRKAAKQAKLSDAEIENEIKFQTSAPGKSNPFEKGPGGFQLGSLEQIQERLGNDWWHLPAALAVFGAGIYGASKLMDDGDTPRTPPPPPPPPPPGGPGMRIDPTFDAEPLPQQAPAPVDALQRQQQMQQIAEANKQLGLGPKPVIPTVAPQFPPAGVPAGDIPPAPPYQPSTPITAAPLDAPAPTPTPGPNSPVTTIVNDTVKEMIQETPNPVTGVTAPPASQAAPKPVPPVYPKAGTKFKTEADIPPGFVVRYDVGNLDRSMGNILGIEHRANARDLFNQGKPFGQSANLNQDVSDLTKRYFQQLQSEIPETILSREARQAQKIPSEFGVFAKNTPFGTGVTVAGKAATLFALPHIANAAQQGNYGSAALQAADIATDYLPFVGQIKQALSPSSAGQGSSAVPSVDQALLLGSPYAQTEFAKKRRQQEEYTRKVGAGRGIAPPSAYQR
jgi:hypothetical protein